MQSKAGEAEPGLYDVLHPVLSRWKLILIGVFVSVGIAAIASSILPKQYQTSFVLVIGFAGENVLEDAVTVARIINSDSFQQSAAEKVGLKVPPGSLKKMVSAQTDANRWNTNWVAVEVRADQPDTAVRFANALADGIIQRHTAYYEDNLRPIKEHHTELKRSTDRITAQIEMLRQQLSNRTGSTANASTDLLLQTRISDNENQLIALRKDVREAEAQMSATHSRNSSVVSPPLRPQFPSKPNLKLNVLAAAIGSAFLMVSGILLFQQYRKASLRF